MTCPPCVLVSWEYPPRVVGGLGTYVHELARALARRGAAVRVVAPGPEGRAREGGVEVWRVPDPFAAEGPSPRAVERFAVEVARRAGQGLLAGVRVIHAHDWLAGPAALYLSRAAGLPLMATFHATDRGRRGPARDPWGWYIAQVEERLAQGAARVLATTPSLAREVTHLTGRRVDCLAPGGVRRVVPGGGREEREPWVLFAGRLERDKGVDVLQAAWEQVEARFPLTLWVAGDGSLRGCMESWARGRRVRLLGFVSPRRLDRLRARSLVGVVPSRYEPFGLAALEHMAAGLPVVAAGVSGLRDWASGAALLVPPGDPWALAEGMCSLVADPRAWERYHKLGCNRARHHPWSRTAEAVARCAHEAVLTGFLAP